MSRNPLQQTFSQYLSISFLIASCLLSLLSRALVLVCHNLPHSVFYLFASWVPSPLCQISSFLSYILNFSPIKTWSYRKDVLRINNGALPNSAPSPPGVSIKNGTKIYRLTLGISLFHSPETQAVFGSAFTMAMVISGIGRDIHSHLGISREDCEFQAIHRASIAAR